jgi:hypothetical protein
MMCANGFGPSANPISTTQAELTSLKSGSLTGRRNHLISGASRPMGFRIRKTKRRAESAGFRMPAVPDPRGNQDAQVQ